MAPFYYLCFLLISKLIGGHSCSYSQYRKQEEANNYAKISSFLPDPIRKNYARIILNNCVFGREQSLSHILHLRYCFDHCSMRETCVAVHFEEDYCRFCYDGTHTSDYAAVDPDKIYVRLSELGRCHP